MQKVNHLLKLFLLISLIGISTAANSSGQAQLHAFPDAESGMQRFVIFLDDKSAEEETHFMVQLLAGKDMLTDGVNKIRLGSKITPQPLKGWGYTYYEVDDTSATLSTLMATPDGATKVSQFVTTAPLNIRYNSRLPIVIYAPLDYQIQYRIWEAPATYKTANPG